MSLYELTVYVSVPPDKADYLLEKLCNTVEDYGYGWERASARTGADADCEYCEMLLPHPLHRQHREIRPLADFF